MGSNAVDLCIKHEGIGHERQVHNINIIFVLRDLTVEQLQAFPTKTVSSNLHGF